MWPIVQATVKEGLGKFNIAPSLDFNQEAAFDIPALRKGESVEPPSITINPNYNPFDSQPKTMPKSTGFGHSKSNNSANWDKLYEGFEQKPSNSIPEEIFIDPEPIQHTIQTEPSYEKGRFFQFKGKYIVTAVKSGLMLIDQKRAHQRILFDEYIYKIGTQSGLGQKLLYPYKFDLEPIESELFKNLMPEITRLGFEVEIFGKNTFVINSLPAEFPDTDVSEWLLQILDNVKNNEKDFTEAIRENIVKSLAKFLSIPYGKILSQEEMAHINDKLFVSQMPNLTPDGKTIVSIIGMDDLEKKFK